jgi:ubiquinone/menaquinone biosynthesis C-methylase UbiE
VNQNNDQQITYWNEDAGPTWVRSQERMDALLAPLSDQALHLAAVKPGERVIDVGCGCGDTSLALADQGASVWGIDISRPMLEQAKARATGRDTVAFSLQDASTASFTPDHDLVFSRFGVMFFAEPVSAFANLRTSLKPDGRVCFICWQRPRDNPWLSVAGRAVEPFLAEPQTPPSLSEPGPFAFADQDFVNEVMNKAGFSSIQITAVTADLCVGSTMDETIKFQSEIGPLSRALAELDEHKRDEALDAARTALEQFLRPEGVVLGAACWIVQARR